MDPRDLASGLRSIDISELPNSQGGTVATGLINALRSGATSWTS